MNTVPTEPSSGVTTAGVEPAAAAGFSKPHAAPAVRRFARELGVDLARVEGSGRNERILESDVKAYVKRVMTGEISLTTQPGGSEHSVPAAPEVDFTRFGEVEFQPLKRIQQISGAQLQRAWQNVPMVTYHDEANVSELEAFRESLTGEAERRGLRLSLLSFLVKALASTLKAFPSFNASLSADGESLVLKKYCHIGIAVDTPNGLVVPVLRDVDRKGVFTLAAELASAGTRAREGRLGPTEMQGGCMSISSLGGIGGSAFSPTVNAPEVAILGVTRSRTKPLWDGTEFVPRLMLPLDLSFDHRVVDGAEAARFLRHFCALVENFGRVLL